MEGSTAPKSSSELSATRKKAVVSSKAPKRINALAAWRVRCPSILKKGVNNLEEDSVPTTRATDARTTLKKAMSTHARTNSRNRVKINNEVRKTHEKKKTWPNVRPKRRTALALSSPVVFQIWKIPLKGRPKNSKVLLSPNTFRETRQTLPPKSIRMPEPTRSSVRDAPHVAVGENDDPALTPVITAPKNPAPTLAQKRAQ
jgi:hypothetical protein